MTNQPKWLLPPTLFFLPGRGRTARFTNFPATSSAITGALDKRRCCSRNIRTGRHHAAAAFREHQLRTVLSRKRRRTLTSEARCGGRTIASRARPNSGRAREKTPRASFILRNGRQAEGLRPDPRELSGTVRRRYADFPFLAWRALPEHHSNKSRDRFHGGFIMPFTGGGTVIHLRTLRPEFIREAFTRYKITYMAVVPLILKNLQRA